MKSKAQTANCRGRSPKENNQAVYGSRSAGQLFVLQRRIDFSLRKGMCETSLLVNLLKHRKNRVIYCIKTTCNPPLRRRLKLWGKVFYSADRETPGLRVLKKIRSSCSEASAKEDTLTFRDGGRDAESRGWGDTEMR